MNKQTLKQLQISLISADDSISGSAWCTNVRLSYSLMNSWHKRRIFIWDKKNKPLLNFFIQETRYDWQKITQCITIYVGISNISWIKLKAREAYKKPPEIQYLLIIFLCRCNELLLLRLILKCLAIWIYCFVSLQSM